MAAKQRQCSPIHTRRISATTMMLSFALSIVQTHSFMTPCTRTMTRSCITIGKAQQQQQQQQQHPEEEDDSNRNKGTMKKQHQQRIPPPSFIETPVDDERKPRRITATTSEPHFWTNWGIEHLDAPATPTFPDTVDSVTDAAREAIAGTLFEKQRLNPNIASNAMTTSIYGYRPVRGERDSGRMGIEIDGAKHLFPSQKRTDACALRSIALVLASKLSQSSWEGFEDEEAESSATTGAKQEESNNTKTRKSGKKETKTKRKSRPVVVYFNTVRQALMASKEMKLLKQEAIEKNRDPYLYDHVSILSLGQNDEIPKSMCQPRSGYKMLYKGKVDPSRGIVLVVQPTDFNDESRPPGPAIHAVSSLQKVLARATIEELPAVILSPRFLVRTEEEGVEQSGYQQSSVYGGIEPPKGPTPWLVRDFSPPVFAWIGCALPLSPHQQQQQQQQQYQETHQKRGSSSEFHFSRVTLTQSVMHENHPWHIFAVKECWDRMPKNNAHGESTLSTSHEYLASTKTSSGRPTKNIMRQIMSEWL